MISSPTSGSTAIHAATDVTVSGVALHRETGDGHVGDSPNATKLWATGGVLAVTATPRITPPPTGTVDGQVPSTPDVNLMLVLLGLASFVLVTGFLTPKPKQYRRWRSDRGNR